MSDGQAEHQSCPASTARLFVSTCQSPSSAFAGWAYRLECDGDVHVREGHTLGNGLGIATLLATTLALECLERSQAVEVIVDEHALRSAIDAGEAISDLEDGGENVLLGRFMTAVKRFHLRVTSARAIQDTERRIFEEIEKRASCACDVEKRAA